MASCYESQIARVVILQPASVSVSRYRALIISSHKSHISFFPSQQGSVEYAQLNHDADHHNDHGNHGNHSVQDDHLDEIDNSAVTDTADHGE